MFSADKVITTTKEEACFYPRRLGHVNLWVDELQPSEDFYSQVCGLKVAFTEPDLIATFLGTGHTPHDLGMMETTKGVSRYGRDGILQLPGHIGLVPGLNHLAWELENEAELVAGWRKAKESEYKVDLTVDHQVAHSVYMFDPDGNYNEFYCDTIKDWRNVLKGPMDLLTVYWDPDVEAPFTEGRYDESPVLETVKDAPIRPKRITHAVLETKNIEAMLDFYTTVAGLQIHKELNGVFFLSSGLKQYSHCLILVPGKVSRFSHGSFELYSQLDLENTISSLSDKNILIEKIVDLPWKKSVFLKDPDGLFSEWYVKKAVPFSAIDDVNLPLWMRV